MNRTKKLLAVLCAICCISAGAALMSASSCSDDHSHTYSDTWTYDETNHWHAATCEHEDETSGTAAHTYTSGITTEPSCTTKGVKTYTCTVCGYSYTEEIAATGHAYATTWSSDDDYHWYAATCDHTDEVSDKAEHTWNDGVVTTPATCTANGVKTYTCTVCGKTKTEEVAIDSTNHGNTEYQVTTRASSSTDGSAKLYCTDCESVVEENITLPYELSLDTANKLILGYGTASDDEYAATYNFSITVETAGTYTFTLTPYGSAMYDIDGTLHFNFANGYSATTTLSAGSSTFTLNASGDEYLGYVTLTITLESAAISNYTTLESISVGDTLNAGYYEYTSTSTDNVTFGVTAKGSNSETNYVYIINYTSNNDSAFFFNNDPDNYTFKGGYTYEDDYGEQQEIYYTYRIIVPEGFTVTFGDEIEEEAIHTETLSLDTEYTYSDDIVYVYTNDSDEKVTLTVTMVGGTVTIYSEYTNGKLSTVIKTVTETGSTAGYKSENITIVAGKSAYFYLTSGKLTVTKYEEEEEQIESWTVGADNTATQSGKDTSTYELTISEEGNYTFTVTTENTLFETYSGIFYLTIGGNTYNLTSSKNSVVIYLSAGTYNVQTSLNEGISADFTVNIVAGGTIDSGSGGGSGESIEGTYDLADDTSGSNYIEVTVSGSYIITSEVEIAAWLNDDWDYDYSSKYVDGKYVINIDLSVGDVLYVYSTEYLSGYTYTITLTD